MKKSNVLVIAAVLIALHVLVFLVFVGKKNDRTRRPAPPPSRPAAATNDESPALPVFKVPELKLPATAETAEKTVAVTPVRMPEIDESAKVRELIAVPGTRNGYLRADRPVRRTTKVYDNLVGDPYQGAIVVDAQTGRILYENRATAYAYPASLTKMMTLLIVLDQIRAGIIHLDDKVAITKEVSQIGGSEIYLDPRESGIYTVDNLLQAMMIHSACDASRALAMHVAGTRAAFVDMMNQKARELGMNSTIYHTEHGLPPSDGTQPDISTAYDMAILSLAVLRHPETLEYTGTKLAWLPTSPIRKEKFMLANRNALVGKDPYPGCDGLKTGYHAKGGYSLAATARQGDERVVAVILGVPDSKTRNETVKQLMDKGFDQL
jgi:D-alanyl-D-alanine carboxypeptidase (penicillin-binding protein 5/6)